MICRKVPREGLARLQPLLRESQETVQVILVRPLGDSCEPFPLEARF